MRKDKISKSAIEIRKLIDKAIQDGEISSSNYDKITHLATEDNDIDNQERILLSQLNEMIFNKEIKIKN